MITRLLAVLALVAVCLVLVPASPAAACSCVGLDRVLAEEPEVAFTGVLRRQVVDDDLVINRFTVSAVHAGAVRRTQDVVSPGQGEAACGVAWTTGDEVVVLANPDDEGRLATNLCMSWAPGDREHETVVEALGEGTEPVVGVDRIEPEGLSRRDLLWVRLVVGVVGFAALGLLVARWLRGRRT